MAAWRPPGQATLGRRQADPLGGWQALIRTMTCALRVAALQDPGGDRAAVPHHGGACIAETGCGGRCAQWRYRINVTARPLPDAATLETVGTGDVAPDHVSQPPTRIARCQRQTSRLLPDTRRVVTFPSLTRCCHTRSVAKLLGDETEQASPHRAQWW